MKKNSNESDIFQNIQLEKLELEKKKIILEIDYLHYKKKSNKSIIWGIFAASSVIITIVCFPFYYIILPVYQAQKDALTVQNENTKSMYMSEINNKNKHILDIEKKNKLIANERYALESKVRNNNGIKYIDTITQERYEYVIDTLNGFIIASDNYWMEKEYSKIKDFCLSKKIDSLKIEFQKELNKAIKEINIKDLQLNKYKYKNIMIRVCNKINTYYYNNFINNFKKSNSKFHLYEDPFLFKEYREDISMKIE